MRSRPMDLGAPGEGSTCRVCERELDPTGRCRHCGAAFGPAHRCPHCGGVADVERGGRLRATCRLCGGPRVPLDAPELRASGQEVEALRRARTALHRWTSLRLGAGATAAVGAAGLLTGAAAAALAPLWLGLGIGAVALLPLLAARSLARRAEGARREGEDALEGAWESVARDVVEQRGGTLTEAELARVLGTTAEHAGALFARLHASEHMISSITDQGEVTVRTRDRVRVEEPVADDAEPEPDEASPPLRRSR